MATAVANFFRETSYGQQLMNVTATPGWVTLNMAQPTTCGTTDWRNIGTSAEAAAKALGSAYDPAAYNFVSLRVPGRSRRVMERPSPTSAVRTRRGSTTPGRSARATITHEMGHNFGLLHAASLRCATAIGGAMLVERVRRSISMRWATSARCTTTQCRKRSSRGFRRRRSRRTPADRRPHTLSPLETGGATTYAVKIPDGRVQPHCIGWSSASRSASTARLRHLNSNGAQIRVSYPFETMCPGCTSNSDDTELLDMTPSTTRRSTMRRFPWGRRSATRRTAST